MELLERCIMSLVPVKAPRHSRVARDFCNQTCRQLWPGSESACHGGGWMTRRVRRVRRGCLGGAAPRPLHPCRRFVSRIRGDATPESRRSGTCTYPRAFSRTLSTSAPFTETWARTRPCAASTSVSEMPIRELLSCWRRGSDARLRRARGTSRRRHAESGRGEAHRRACVDSR